MTQKHNGVQRIDVLLVDDDSADIELTRRALTKGNIFGSLNVVEDGIEAMEYLRREGDYADATRPHLILLDLNMPRKDGRETLAEIKSDELLRNIPVIIFTTSRASVDIADCYRRQANCFVTKPVDFQQFSEVISGIKEFWGCVAEYSDEAE